MFGNFGRIDIDGVSGKQINILKSSLSQLRNRMFNYNRELKHATIAHGSDFLEPLKKTC